MGRPAVPTEVVESVRRLAPTHTRQEVADILGRNIGSIHGIAKKYAIEFCKPRPRKECIYRDMAMLLYEHGYKVSDIHSMNFNDISVHGLRKYLKENERHTKPTLH